MQFNCRHCGALIALRGGVVGCPHNCKDPFPEFPEVTERKFSCPCCGDCDLDRRLLPALLSLALRARDEKPGAEIEILAAYRCEKYNAGARGLPKQAHMDGRACDLRIRGLSLDEMYLLAQSVPEFEAGGIGLHDDGSMHVDVRVFPTRWARVKGQYVSLAGSRLRGGSHVSTK